MIVLKRLFPVESMVAINPDNVVWIEPVPGKSQTLIMFLNGPTMTVAEKFEDVLALIRESK